MSIYKIVGDISYSRPEFLQRVKDKFAAKQAQLKKATLRLSESRGGLTSDCDPKSSLPAEMF